MFNTVKCSTFAVLKLTTLVLKRDMRNGLTMPRILLLIAEVIAFAILAWVATGRFGMSDGLGVTAAYAVAYAVPRLLLWRARGSSLGACVLLFVVAVFLMWLDVIRLTGWVEADGFSLQMPNLLNDARFYYKWALYHYNGSAESSSTVFPGFPLMMLALWKVFGLSAVWPQAMNLMFTLMSVVLTGMTTRRLLTGHVAASSRTLVLGGMAMTSMLVYYLVISTSLLKEGPICLAMAMAGYALASMAAVDEERHHAWRDLAVFVLACVLMGFVRTTYLYFIALGIVVMVIPHWRRDWMMALAMMATLLVALLVGDHYASYSFERHAEIIGGGWNMQRFYIKGESQILYRKVLDYYFLYSPWHRVLMLPLTMSVQFLIPLPWLYFERLYLLNIVSRLTWGWYLVGGTAMFYYVVMCWHRQGRVGLWPWWPALAFAVLAYVMAGSTARYVLPIEPLFVPVAMYVVCNLAEGRWRRQFKVWSVLFILLLALALTVCFMFQRGYIDRLLG